MLLRRLKELIEKALRRRKGRSREKIAEEVQVELRKIPVTFKVCWKGRKYSNYEIAVDLTLCIKLSGEWPAVSDIRRRLNRGHPGYEAFRKAVRAGYHLVASTIGESGKHRACWRFSFSVAEGIVLKSIFKNLRLVHKVTFTNGANFRNFLKILSGRMINLESESEVFYKGYKTLLKRKTFVVFGFQTTNSLISGLGMQPRPKNSRIIFPGSYEISKIFKSSRC